MSYSLDFEASKNYYLGDLCDLKHDWEGTGCSLRRIKNNECKQCERLYWQRKYLIERANSELANRPSIAQLEARRKQFGNMCAYCQTAVANSFDHFIPVGKGGSARIENIVPCCCQCNKSKRSLDASEWYKQQPFYSAERFACIVEILQRNLSVTVNANRQVPPQISRFRMVNAICNQLHSQDIEPTVPLVKERLANSAGDEDNIARLLINDSAIASDIRTWQKWHSRKMKRITKPIPTRGRTFL